MKSKQKVEQADFSPFEIMILDSIIEDEIEFQLWMQAKRADKEMQRALNSCGMSKGGTFTSENYCATGNPNQGKGKTKSKAKKASAGKSAKKKVPRLVYHGTNHDFKKFSVNENRKSFTPVAGVYFSPDKSEAEKHGKRVITAEIKLKNPANTKQVQAAMQQAGEEGVSKSEKADRVAEILIEQGFDGLIYDGQKSPYMPETYVVFDVKQIKQKKNYKHDLEVLEVGDFLTPVKDPPQYRKVNLVGDSKNADYFDVPTQEQVNKYIQPPKRAKMEDGFFVKKSGEKLLSGMPFMDKYDGELVHARIDIPAYKKSKAAGELVYAVTLHYPNKAGSKHAESAAYLPMAVLDSVSFIAQDRDAALIQQKFRSKSPIATVAGKLNKKETMAQKMPDDIESWIPVGYNPSHATFFYDKRTGREVVGGGKAISVGNTVFIKKPKYGDRDATKKKQAQSFPAKGWTSDEVTADYDTRKKSTKGIVDLKAMSKEHDLYDKNGEVKRALNPCGMNDGGTFAKGNSCAGTKGTGKSQPKKPKRKAPKYTPKKWKQKLNDWMDRNNLDSSKFWNKAKGRVELPDMETIKAIAEEQAQGKPDAATNKSYEEFKKHLMSQYEALVDSGLVVKAWRGEGEPYKQSEEKMWVPSSKKMREKVEETGVFYFFMTDKGFGAGEKQDSDHPLLQMSSAKTADGEPMLYNDVFRVVHDAVAHLNGGYSFSTRGEMNAMLAHASTLPKETWAALWAETFAQNAYYEVNKKFADQNYFTSEYVDMIEDLQQQAQKQTQVARADMPIEHDDEDGECGCNRKRRALAAKVRYYAKRFLANKSRPDIKRFTTNPAKKKKKGKVGGCGNSGQGFVEGNTCAKGTPAGPTTGEKAAKKKQPSFEGKHPNTETVFDNTWLKEFAGKQRDARDPEKLTKAIAAEIRKKEKTHDVFLVPTDKNGKVNGQIVNVDSTLRLGDGKRADALGLANGEYRLEFIGVEQSPLRDKDVQAKSKRKPVRTDNPKRGKRFKSATKNMTANQAIKYAKSVLPLRSMSAVEKEDLQKYIQHKVDQEKETEGLLEQKKKKKAEKEKPQFPKPKAKKKKSKAKPKRKTKPLDDFDYAISEGLAEFKDESKATPAQDRSGRPKKLVQNLKSSEAKLRNEKFEHSHSFDATGNPLFVATSGNTEYIQYSREQIDQLKDGVNTHNHPKGGSFSPDDVNFAIEADLKETRVVSPETGYTFVLQRPKNGWGKNFYGLYHKARQKVGKERFGEISEIDGSWTKKTLTREMGKRFFSELVIQEWITQMQDAGFKPDDMPKYYELLDAKN